MTADKAVSWLRAEQFNQWMLFRGEEEKVSNYEGEESVEESINRFEEIITLQQPGKYLLKGYKGRSKQAASMSFRFDIKHEISQPASRHTPTSFNPEDLFNKAKEAALREFQMDQWRKEVEKGISDLKEEIEKVKLSIQELFDDDEDNDDDALDRISDAATKLPGIANGLQGIGKLFQK